MGVDVLSCNVPLASESTDRSARSGRLNATPAVTMPTPTSVKRCLFGPVDHAETMSFFQKEFARAEEESRMRYNFDFRNERPLEGEGRYKWEKLENVSILAACKNLRSPSKVTKLRTKRSPLKSKVNRDNVDANSRTKQTSITDYLDKSKSIVMKQRAANK